MLLSARPSLGRASSRWPGATPFSARKARGTRGTWSRQVLETGRFLTGGGRAQGRPYVFRRDDADGSPLIKSEL